VPRRTWLGQKLNGLAKIILWHDTCVCAALGGRLQGAGDLLGRRPGGGAFVDAQRLADISDPEMDMNRAVGRAPRVGTSRLAAALRWLAPGVYTLQTPRRSVDRELDEFSSPWD